MNLKQLGILLAVVAVIGGAGLVLYRNQQSSWSSGAAEAGKKLLGDNFPINDVAHIAIRHDTNEVNLVKADGLWRVRERNNYRANYSEITDLFWKIRDLKVVQSEPVGSSQLPRLELAPGQGNKSPVTLEFKNQEGKVLGTLLLGKKHMKKGAGPSPQGDGDEGWPAGRYVKTGADSPNVALISDPLENVEPRSDRWLDKEFFKVEKARSVSVRLSEATNSWAITREEEGGEWKLSGAAAGEELDPSKVADLSNPLSSPTFGDVQPGDKIGESQTDEAIVTIETFDNFTYSVKVGAKTNDNYLVTVAVGAQISKERTPVSDEKPEDAAKADKEFKERQETLQNKLKREQEFASWTYSVPSWVMEPVLKQRLELMTQKAEQAGSDGAAAGPGKDTGETGVKPAFDAGAHP